MFLYSRAKFLQLFKHAKRYIVHISSLVGVQPFSSLSVYCTGKAARDMMFRAVATEEVLINRLLLQLQKGRAELEVILFSTQMITLLLYG